MSSTEEKSIVSNRRCPRCGGEVEIQLAFSSQFCGIRAVGSCKNGCVLTPREQRELDMEASEAIFG